MTRVSVLLLGAGGSRDRRGSRGRMRSISSPRVGGRRPREDISSARGGHCDMTARPSRRAQRQGPLPSRSWSAARGRAGRDCGHWAPRREVAARDGMLEDEPDYFVCRIWCAYSRTRTSTASSSCRWRRGHPCLRAFGGYSAIGCTFWPTLTGASRKHGRSARSVQARRPTSGSRSSTGGSLGLLRL